MFNPITMNAFADELNKLASARIVDDEIEKLAELELVARQLVGEFGITKKAAYEVLKEAGFGGAALKLLSKAKGLTQAGRMAQIAKAPGVTGGLSPKQLAAIAGRGRGAVPMKGIATQAVRRPSASAAGMLARARGGGSVGAGRMF